MPPLRVCVLRACNKGSDSDVAKAEENFPVTPAHFYRPHWPPAGTGCDELHANIGDDLFTFHTVEIVKKDTYRTVRRLVKSGEYDVFFNLCDGAKDEDRAGVEVVQALEELGAAFTGATSKFYEPSKPQMRMVAHYNGIPTAHGVVVNMGDDIAAKTAGLAYPLLIKHSSGYSSIGMTKDCKCHDQDHLVKRARQFIAEYGEALIEEFVAGDEATVLACADPSEPDGVRVYPPVMIQFPQGEDFKHWSLKWEGHEGMHWQAMAEDHPAYASIVDIGRKAFKAMLNGVGYGRTDVRIRRDTHGVVFLEINPNCGLMYEYGAEGSADNILRFAGANGAGHRQFVELQVAEAMRQRDAHLPLFEVQFDAGLKDYTMVARRPISPGEVVLRDEGRPTRLHTVDYVRETFSEEDRERFKRNAWPMGSDRHVYAVWDLEPSQWRPVSHSCDPNMGFVRQRQLNVAALRPILKGERLTMNFTTFADDQMPPMPCNCGARFCEGVIRFSQTPEYLQQHQELLVKSFHRPASEVSSNYYAEHEGSGSDSSVEASP